MLPIADNLIYNKHTICQSGGGEDVGIYGIQDRAGICITYFWMEIGDKWSLFANVICWHDKGAKYDFPSMNSRAIN